MAPTCLLGKPLETPSAICPIQSYPPRKRSSKHTDSNPVPGLMQGIPAAQLMNRPKHSRQVIMAFREGKTCYAVTTARYGILRYGNPHAFRPFLTTSSLKEHGPRPCASLAMLYLSNWRQRWHAEYVNCCENKIDHCMTGNDIKCLFLSCSTEWSRQNFWSLL